MTLDHLDKTAAAQLSRRERQIMDALFEAGELSAQMCAPLFPTHLVIPPCVHYLQSWWKKDS